MPTKFRNRPLLDSHRSTPARLALALGVSLLGATMAIGDHPASMNRVGRLFGFGWSDGYHACCDSGCRPGADLPPRGYADQFGHKKKTKKCDACNAIYPPGTALGACKKCECDGGACDQIPSHSNYVDGPSELPMSHAINGAIAPGDMSGLPATGGTSSSIPNATPTEVPSYITPPERGEVSMPGWLRDEKAPSTASGEGDEVEAGVESNLLPPPLNAEQDPANVTSPSDSQPTDELLETRVPEEKSRSPLVIDQPIETLGPVRRLPVVAAEEPPKPDAAPTSSEDAASDDLGPDYLNDERFEINPPANFSDEATSTDQGDRQQDSLLYDQSLMRQSIPRNYSLPPVRTNPFFARTARPTSATRRYRNAPAATASQVGRQWNPVRQPD